jgi:hypothetical protein
MLDAGGLVVAGGKPPFGYEIQNAASVWDAMLAASPQEEGSSADTHPPQPDALPGDLREKVAAVLYENIGAAAWSGDAEVHGIPEAADAILSLIQSEKKEQ